MSVNAISRLKGFVDPKIIYNIIYNRYDMNAVFDITAKSYEGETVTSGYIYFKDSIYNQYLYYYHSTHPDAEEVEHYRKIGLEEMVESSITDISMNTEYGGDSITKYITQIFGGWWTNCDDEFIAIDKVIQPLPPQNAIIFRSNNNGEYI